MWKIFVPAFACAMAFGLTGAQASTYPVRPITLIVPYAAGGAADSVARVVASKMSLDLGQTVVVSNRPGANAKIGTAELAQSGADGYTLGLILSTHIVNPFVPDPPAYDPLKSFTPVAYISRMPGVMVVSASVPATSIGELRKLVESKPSDYFYAVPGGFTNGHVTMEMFKQATSLDITPVMFKGGAPASLEVAAGRVQMMIISPTAILPFIKDGRLKAIASTGAESPRALPGLPTFKASGLPELETYEWVGMLAPAGMPADRVARIEASVSKALKAPEVVDTLHASSMEIIDGNGEVLRSHMMKELERMRALSAKVKF